MASKFKLRACTTLSGSKTVAHAAKQKHKKKKIQINNPANKRNYKTDLAKIIRLWYFTNLASFGSQLGYRPGGARKPPYQRIPFSPHYHFQETKLSSQTLPVVAAAAETVAA